MPQQSPLAQHVRTQRAAAHPQVRRKDKGMAGNGGRFATAVRGEPDVTIPVPAPTQMIGDAAPELMTAVLTRLRSAGVSGDPAFADHIARAWHKRFYPDGLTSHSREDAAVLRGGLPPWRPLAAPEETQEAAEASRSYITQRRARDEDISGAQQVFAATDQMLVELGAEDRRRKREVIGLVLSQAVILAVPRQYRGYAQGAFSAYMIAKALIGPQRRYAEEDIEASTQTILDQQEQVRRQVQPAIEQMNRERARAEEAQWTAGLGSRTGLVRYRGQQVGYLDVLAGMPRVEAADVDSELDVEIS